MKKCAIEVGRRVAAVLVAAGVCFSSAGVRAGDAVPGDLPAASVPDAGTSRPIVVKSITVGRLQSGEIMVLNGRGVERLRPIRLAEHREQAPGSSTAADYCETF